MTILQIVGAAGFGAFWIGLAIYLGLTRVADAISDAAAARMNRELELERAPRRTLRPVPPPGGAA